MSFFDTKLSRVLMWVFLISMSVAISLVNSLHTKSLQEENIRLQKEIDENETSRSGGLEVAIDGPQLREALILTDQDPSTFPLPYNKYLRETSPQGIRTSPITGDTVNHLGWDICGRPKSEVYAAGSGKITDIWIPGGMVINGVKFRGHPTRDGYIEIDHGNFTSTYSHLSYTTVYNIGDYVQAGQIIGRTGSGGLSTGDHLHFEIRDNETKEYKDPLEFFNLIYIDDNGRIWFKEELSSPVSTF